MSSTARPRYRVIMKFYGHPFPLPLNPVIYSLHYYIYHLDFFSLFSLIEASPPHKQGSGPDDPPAKKHLGGHRLDSRVRGPKSEIVGARRNVRSLGPVT